MEQFFAKDPVNTEKLNEDIQAVYPQAGVISDDGGVRISMPDDTTQQTWDAIAAIIAAHDASVLTEGQKKALQAENARIALLALIDGLHNLSVIDKGYALYGRLMASGDGASQVVIDAIIDRPSAVAYITSKSEWAAATAATRNLVADVLEANARLCMVLLLVL